MGVLRLGIKIQDLTGVWGSPDRVIRGSVLVTYEFSKYRIYAVAYGETIVAAESSDPRYHTNTGITIGSTEGQIVAGYGANYERKADQITYSTLGLTLGIDNGRVSSIRVFSEQYLLAVGRNLQAPSILACNYRVDLALTYYSNVTVIVLVRNPNPVPISSVTISVRIFRYLPSSVETLGRGRTILRDLRPQESARYSGVITMEGRVLDGYNCEALLVSFDP